MKSGSFGSNRRFGLVMAVACFIVAALAYWYEWGHPGPWLIAALVLLLIALTMPRTLDPLKRLWLKVGGFLHLVVSPVMLTAFYYLGVAPIGLVMQLAGKDPLRLKPNAQSYWVERKPPGPDPKTMPELF